MGLVRTWRRQIYGASLVAVLIPAAIIVALFAVTGGGPLHGIGALGQVFSGPAIPGGNQSARVVTNSKPALPGKGTVGAAALRGHSPLVGPSRGPSGGPRVIPLAPSPAGSRSAPLSSGGRLNGGAGTLGNSGNGPPGGSAPPPRPVTTPTTTATQTTATQTSTTVAASLPPIVAVPPPTVTTPTTTVTTTTTATTPTTTTSRTSTTTRTTTTTTRTTTTTKTTTASKTTSTSKTTTTSKTPTTTTPTTKTTTTTRTLTTPSTPPPRGLSQNVTPAVSVTVAQSRSGSTTFRGCSGNWGVAPTGHVEVASRAGSSHAASNGGTSTSGRPDDRRL